MDQLQRALDAIETARTLQASELRDLKTQITEQAQQIVGLKEELGRAYAQVDQETRDKASAEHRISEVDMRHTEARQALAARIAELEVANEMLAHHDRESRVEIERLRGIQTPKKIGKRVQ